MLATTKTLLGSLSFSTLILLFSCSDTKKNDPSSMQVKAASTTEQSAKTETPVIKLSEDGPAIATITAPNYLVKVHRAIAFVPKDDGSGMMKAKPGHRYVVLDMSAKNTSKDAEVDMGQILLSTKVTDENGKEHQINVMAIAAYTLNNPNPHHQAQYNALWSTLKPGDFYRTTVLGLEIPESVKSLVISMKEDGDIFKESKRLQANFPVE